MRRRDTGEVLGTVAAFPAAFAFMLFMLVPVLIMVKVSLSGPEDIFTQHPPFLIHHATLDHWREIIAAGGIRAPFQRSLVVATGTTVLALLVAAPGAYVISRMPRKWRYPVLVSLFLTRMFPEVGIALAVAVNFIRWNMLDTDLGLILAHLIGALPFIAWILVGTFETIPVELEEAAKTDGCGRVAVLRRVILPLSLSGVAVACIFTWLWSWNEFTYALYLSLSRNTLPLETYYYLGRGSLFNAATYSTILTLPVFLVTFTLQKYLRSGYLTGAVKG
ncbi:MAG: carbohydrate ABC transporter permease [Bacteroidota bacterium]